MPPVTNRGPVTPDRRSRVIGGVAVVFGAFAAILGSGLLALTLAFDLLFVPEIENAGTGTVSSRLQADAVLVIHTPIWVAGGLALGLCGAALRARDTRARRLALMAAIAA